MDVILRFKTTESRNVKSPHPAEGESIMNPMICGKILHWTNRTDECWFNPNKVKEDKDALILFDFHVRFV